MGNLQEAFIDHMLDVLNRAIEKDRDAIQKLLEHRVSCNEALARDETIQVRKHMECGERYTVSMGGILSGLAGVNNDSWSRIASIYDELGRLVGFERFAR